MLMIPIDLNGKVALVTGVGTTKACMVHRQRLAGGRRAASFRQPSAHGHIVGNLLGSDKPDDAAGACSPLWRREPQPEKILACDVSYDTMETWTKNQE